MREDGVQRVPDPPKERPTVTGTTSARLSSGSAEDGTSRPVLRRALVPVNLVIIVATLAALGLRAIPLANPHVLLGVTEYDDGVYFGSAVRLVNGVLPYRDFIIVQPPGIIALMLPPALLAKVVGTAWGMAAGRIMTTLASTISVAMAGLLIRHRGVLATAITSAVMVAYPSSLVDARSVLLEPWLVFFCLLAALAVFDGDQLTDSRRRLAWGGIAAGFAGTVEAWAIIPVLVIIVLAVLTADRTQLRLRRALTFAAGVAIGFCVPVAPFAALGPGRFFQCIISSQFNRVLPATTPFWFRLSWLTGVGYQLKLRDGADFAVALGVVLVVVVAVIAGWALSRRAPSPLDWFALVTTALVILAFLWYQLFFLHYPAFLAPFLGMAIGLPVGRLVSAIGERRADPDAADGLAVTHPPLARSPMPLGAIVAAVAIVLCAALQIGYVAKARSEISAAGIAAARALIPPGACVITDQESYLIAADRFSSTVPGCSQMVDPLGIAYALAGGREGDTGSGRVPAVAAIFRSAFEHADYAWLTTAYEARRISWTPALHRYFSRHFRPVYRDGERAVLYVRTPLLPQR